MKKWILTNQTLIALIIGGCSVLIVFLIDFRGPVALAAFVLSIVLIAVGSWLFKSDTSENWLEISYGRMVWNVVGTILLFSGWTILLRYVLATAIAAVLLRIG